MLRVLVLLRLQLLHVFSELLEELGSLRTTAFLELLQDLLLVRHSGKLARSSDLNAHHFGELDLAGNDQFRKLHACANQANPNHIRANSAADRARTSPET